MGPFIGCPVQSWVPWIPPGGTSSLQFGSVPSHLGGTPEARVLVMLMTQRSVRPICLLGRLKAHQRSPLPEAGTAFVQAVKCVPTRRARPGTISTDSGFGGG